MGGKWGGEKGGRGSQEVAQGEDRRQCGETRPALRSDTRLVLRLGVQRTGGSAGETGLGSLSQPEDGQRCARSFILWALGAHSFLQEGGRRLGILKLHSASVHAAGCRGEDVGVEVLLPGFRSEVVRTCLK